MTEGVLEQQGYLLSSGLIWVNADFTQITSELKGVNMRSY